jgi:hypothetical protein
VVVLFSDYGRAVVVIGNRRNPGEWCNNNVLYSDYGRAVVVIGN